MQLSCREGFVLQWVEDHHIGIEANRQAAFALQTMDLCRTRAAHPHPILQAEATLAHKETAHYAKWRDAVADMMETPRFSKKFTQLS